MQKKWYFSTLLLALTSLIVMQQRTVVPNQEIILDFNIDITSPEAQTAIAVVQKQLQSIGAKNTRISKGKDNGTLIITYYSDTDISCIKSLLSEKQQIVFDSIFDEGNESDEEFPNKKNIKEYTVAIYKIQQSTDTVLDFISTTTTLEVQREAQAYSNASSFDVALNNNYENLQKLNKEVQKVQVKVAFASDNTSHNIPEVRAGPIIG